MRERISFWFYYVKLRIAVSLGTLRTTNPLNIEWRRRHWQGIKAAKRRKRMY
jgi:hypothetical protein